MLHSPPFGTADLTNCERELIHLAGSTQPHGLLLVLRASDLQIVQATSNVGVLLGVPVQQLLERPLSVLGGDVEACLRTLLGAGELVEPLPLNCRSTCGPRARELEGMVHRIEGRALVLELEPVDGLDASAGGPEMVATGSAALMDQLAVGVQRVNDASTVGLLADAVVKTVRDMTGYDRVMVYKFDPDGHGKIIAEARHPRLDPLLGHHYPASDIPQRARELYLRTRVRVLVDAAYVPAPLVPARLPLTGGELDMSLCYLRSMSPLHTQYLRNMGVTATLVVSLVRDGRLWGLIAAHHYAPRNLRHAVRAAAELLGSVASTRITAIENYAHAQVAILVRQLQQRLIDATSTEGDWHLALFRNPRTLLQPLDATGAALFHDGEVLTTGEVPSTPELRALLQWVGEAHVGVGGEPFACSAVARTNPALASLTPVASGVLAVKLSTTRPDYLMWFRKEQLLTVTWAGDPAKPVVGNDPLELSPRRSFAAWSEIVSGTGAPWAGAEIALARAIGSALVDIIVQVQAVRLLVAEHQIAQTRATLQSSDEPVLISNAQGAALLSNQAFARLAGRPVAEFRDLDGMAMLFTQHDSVGRMLATLRDSRQPWRGELQLLRAGQGPLPVSVRAELVSGRDGAVLGFILILADLSGVKRTEAARQHLEHSLTLAAMTQAGPRADLRLAREHDEVIGAILTNASLAAMDIADAAVGPSVAPLLEELEAATERATTLYAQIRRSVGGGSSQG